VTLGASGVAQPTRESSFIPIRSASEVWEEDRLKGPATSLALFDVAHSKSCPKGAKTMQPRATTGESVTNVITRVLKGRNSGSSLGVSPSLAGPPGLGAQRRWIARCTALSGPFLKDRFSHTPGVARGWIVAAPLGQEPKKRATSKLALRVGVSHLLALRVSMAGYLRGIFESCRVI